ncbi:MAG: peptidylprolyl isomerase [Flavobacteriaceae bacterium]
MKKAYVLLMTMSMVLSACKSSQHSDLGDGLFADITTNKGEIIIKLEQEKTPVTVANFVTLAEGTSTFVSDSLKGKKYFDGLIFHRVMKDFMIQTGDPMGVGMGGPGYKFKDEIHDSLMHDGAGIVSMANPGPPNTNGSQFFITHKETPWLNGKHTVFGKVVEGLTIVDSIANVAVSTEGATVNRPLEAVVMEKVDIIRNGKEAKQFDALKVMSDYFTEEKEKIAAAEKIKAAQAAELAAQKAEADSLPSGLKILKLKEGTGEKPKLGQIVNVYYAGFLADGTLFDSNYEEIAKQNGMYEEQRKMQGGYEATPMEYSAESRLVAGFREALLTMKVGDKLRIFLPPHLGWGAQGAGPIPPNSETIFDLEITGISE